MASPKRFIFRAPPCATFGKIFSPRYLQCARRTDRGRGALSVLWAAAQSDDRGGGHEPELRFSDRERASAAQGAPLKLRHSCAKTFATAAAFHPYGFRPKAAQISSRTVTPSLALRRRCSSAAWPGYRLSGFVAARWRTISRVRSAELAPPRCRG